MTAAEKTVEATLARSAGILNYRSKTISFNFKTFHFYNNEFNLYIKVKSSENFFQLIFFLKNDLC